MGRNHCPLAERIKKIVASNLEKTNRCVYGDGTGQIKLGSRLSAPKMIEPVSIDEAWMSGVLNLQNDGNIVLCDEIIEVTWDIKKLQRKIEDEVRKTASKNNSMRLIKIATCLGIDFR